MGNCIVLEKKVIKVIKTDGETLEYKPPMKVHHVLSKFDGHTISDALPVLQHLNPDAAMIGGRVYHLLPPLTVPSNAGKKIVEVSSPVAAGVEGTGRLRIKLIISKKELQALLQKGGVTVDDMVSKLHTRRKMNDTNTIRSDHQKSSIGWMPELESIPEGN